MKKSSRKVGVINISTRQRAAAKPPVQKKEIVKRILVQKYSPNNDPAIKRLEERLQKI